MFNKHKKRLHGTIGEDIAKIINDSTPLGIVEAFRTLYTNIQYLSIADKCKKIAVTSAVAGEGKSYICANLSITLAQSNTKKKVLVIDADMRRPRLAALLKNYIKEGNTEVGLTEYLAGIVDTPNILRTTLDNLFVLSSGSNAPNPTSFIISEKFDQVIKLFESEYDYIIFDTAGRLHIDSNLMDELKNLEGLANPDEVILVIDAMMGQDAINVINGFNDALHLTGCILTKLDGNTKGGVALSVRHLTNIPIKFVGDSEKLDGLQEFHPTRMAERILDMGDIMSIAEKVESVIDEDEVKNQANRMKKGIYDLEDFLANLKQLKKLGPLEKILGLLPQARQMGLNNININPKDMAHVEAIILSMTKEERRNPEILKASRKQRIANGSGRSVEEVNRLLKQFDMMKHMMRQVTSGNFPKF